VAFSSPGIIQASINNEAFVLTFRQTGLTNGQQNGLWALRNDHPSKDLVIDKILFGSTLAFVLSLVTLPNLETSTLWSAGIPRLPTRLRASNIPNQFLGTARVSGAAAQTVLAGNPVLDFQLAFALSSQEFLGVDAAVLLAPGASAAMASTPTGAGGVASGSVYMYYL
jgi:hypothetical protein